LPLKEQDNPPNLDKGLGVVTVVGKHLSDEHRLRILSSRYDWLHAWTKVSSQQ